VINTIKLKLNFKIVITGGSGRFGTVLQKKYKSNKLFYPTKKKLNILSLRSIEKYLKKIKPKILIHAAGLSRPMNLHEDNISKSIDLNIIGTANIVKACSKLKIKLIYFSTNYVYPGTKGNYKEYDPIFPINNYAWSKLGGESSVQLYKNSLILRVCMTERPFIHKKAFKDFKTNFIFQDEIAKILFKILTFKGILNLGGKSQSVYNFARKFNPKIKPVSIKNSKFLSSYPDVSMNTDKIKRIINA
jgi:dTDP-4-dehydrorhamnose reductase